MNDPTASPYLQSKKYSTIPSSPSFKHKTKIETIPPNKVDIVVSLNNFDNMINGSQANMNIRKASLKTIDEVPSRSPSRIVVEMKEKEYVDYLNDDLVEIVQ